jgi:beta-glucanase (GH16 family)
MKPISPLHFKNQPFIFFLVFAATILMTIAGCKKEESDFTPSFTVEMIDDNNVRFINQSTGEYYFMNWDFGNGVTETTTDKNKTFEVYYPEAGDYAVSLRIQNNSGESKTTSQTVTIASDDTSLEVSFTAEVDAENPNYVNLKNTTVGQYDSFKWIYRDQEVPNAMEHQAYFPLAGDYEIELRVTRSSQDISEKQMVTIEEDDPDYDPNLVWSEEFNYTGLPSSTYWNMETGGGGWGNNELQYYTDSENNAYVDGGVLTITAREESVGGRDYTSARITTQDKFEFQYGRIEARIKLPYGQGIWPAFWMLGARFSSVGWPACGEIDIMEMVGGSNNRDNTCHSTIHWDQNGSHAEYGESYTLSSGIFADDYHIFSVEWNSSNIRAYVDGTQYFIVDITPAELSEFRENFFVILNVAVGGNWPGPPDGSTTFPQTMEVDYIRVYKINQ